ncbi:MAG: S8 family serine peptidase [Planctomycetota bacterium]
MSRQQRRQSPLLAIRDTKQTQYQDAIRSFARLPGAESVIEQCEQRLVLSAQLLAEVIVDQDDVALPSSVPTLPQLSEAHASTGHDIVSEQFGLTGAGQTVAVIDSGITWDHVALGQGYGPGYRVVGGWDFAENDDQPYDDGPAGFHGTHVSGIIGSDYESQSGVAPDVDFVSLRVFNDIGEGQLDWVESALQWVHDNQDSFENPITTVNVSVGTLWNGDEVPEWGTLEDELQQLYEDGIVVTASAGNAFADFNTTGLSYPASSQYVLPVASVDQDGDLSDFSQRNQRVLAAPGSNITSSVPDHVLGRDGRYDDFTAASGTSMASPYVAGASVLVRQAMEMAGWSDIDTESIVNHLHNTADSVFDSVTGQSYDRLDLAAAIRAILPSDEIGDSAADAANVDFGSIRQGTELGTWVNSLGDHDVYTFTADASGSLSLDASSDWVEDLQWTIQSNGQTVASSSNGEEANLIAGQQYQLTVSSVDSIGPASLGLSFSADTSGGGSSGANQTLGSVDYLDTSVSAGSAYSLTAQRDGTVSVLWSNPDSASGAVTVNAGGRVESTSAWENGTLRLDVNVQAGDQVLVTLPGISSDSGDLTVANLIQESSGTLQVTGTHEQDHFELELGDQIAISVGKLDYSFDASQISEIQIDGLGNHDEIAVRGSEGIDRVNLTPGESSVANSQVQVSIDGVEQVAYAGGGGSDRVYLYDSDTDDVLRAYPGRAELVGVGYRFDVEDISRIFIHATGGGQDYAYLYDSAGDDHLSARPQFSSISGEGFFNYVRGFERVYAYANAGGDDSAELYDSEHADRFLTSGVSASVVGPGFSSYVRNFEQVEAIANAGGNDRATLYGEAGQTAWQQGADFVSFDEATWQREARGFEQIETYRDGLRFNIQPFSTPVGGLDTFSINEVVQTDNLPQRDWMTYGPQQLGSVTGLPVSLQALDLHLPEERLLVEDELEQSVLHEAFSAFAEQDEG